MSAASEREALTIRDIIGEAIGEASACWETLEHAGVFQSQRAAAIVDALVLKVEAHYRPTPRTVTTVEEECERWLSGLGRPEPEPHIWTNGARAFAKHLAATALAPAIDPDDEALVEKVAEALYESRRNGETNPAAWPSWGPAMAQDYWRRQARAALKAVAP